jgi:hypothetical protein
MNHVWTRIYLFLSFKINHKNIFDPIKLEIEKENYNPASDSCFIYMKNKKWKEMSTLPTANLRIFFAAENWRMWACAQTHVSKPNTYYIVS